MGPWNVNFAQTYQKGYSDIASSFSGDERNVAGYAVYDLQATYSAFKSWKFTLGARNLFDRDPPYTNVGGQTQFQFGYDAQYADPRGRFVYGRVTYLFQ
jgi:iron complex outermembrane receptor protein